ncbi:Spy/CpxP family protein refolding chaperone [Massilia sp. LXY-6]|uniref:Spy/CpxP family protein refolding chaperone n=1 Tax=Massilia sp. LXY-6 TaxID=3379823 RepID=UPI003EE0DE20
MNLTRQTLAAALLAACCATTYAAGQSETPSDAGQNAAQVPRSGPESRGPEMRGFRPEGGPEHGRGPGGPGHGFGQGVGHFGAGLRLSEAQQDKLFAIRHAAAPQHRQLQKAVRHAHEALRALRDAAQFDEARAGAASRDLGQAIAAEALLEARVHAQAMAVLTPEQREQLRRRHPQAPRERQ